jgi:hypothetical protein
MAVIGCSDVFVNDRPILTLVKDGGEVAVAGVGDIIAPT